MITFCLMIAVAYRLVLKIHLRTRLHHNPLPH